MVVTSSRKSKHASLVCDRQRSRGCTGVGYRAEHHVDRGLLAAVSAPLRPSFWKALKEELAVALAEQQKDISRVANLERVSRDVHTLERRVRNLTSSVAEAGDALERAPLMAALREEGRRLEAAREALKGARSIPSGGSQKTILEAAESRVRALRETLDAGGVRAIPAVRELLGDEKLYVARNEGGGWLLRGKMVTVRLFEDSFKKQKKAVKGTVEVPAASLAPAATPAPTNGAPAPAPSVAAASHS